MRREQLEEVLRTGEGQTVEFKTSFAEQKEAIQTMVGFANSQGGRVFIGVEDDGTVVPVAIGKNTLENLAADIRDHTYPSLPAFIEQLDCNGEKIVVAEVAADTPPIIGVYLWSADPVSPDKPVDADKLQAYRRVGRANLKEDFMRVREALRSDPRIRIQLGDVFVRQQEPWYVTLQGYVWAEEGSPTAHSVSFRLDPPVGECSQVYSDLPFPLESMRGALHELTTEREFVALAKFAFSCPNMLDSPPTLRLISSYKDDWGLTWESGRRLELSVREENGQQVPNLVDAGEFSRRIVGFPPKRQ